MKALHRETVTRIAEELSISRASASLIRKWAREDGASVTQTPEGRLESRLGTISRLLGGHGVEYVEAANGSFFHPYGFSYVNMGDTYKTTILYDWNKRRFLLCSVGDMVEQAPEGTYL
jgi:hypothetical protein